MTTRIVIQHLGGSKANQIEQFPTDSAGELTIGREPGSSILFDATRDDTVSRKHASIMITPGDPPSFKLVDHNSRNGTILNEKRLQGEGELLPGDVIELGTRGAKFTFDLDPRPANLTGRTRMIDTGVIGTTRVFDAATRSDTAVGATLSQRPAKVGVGRETLMHMLAEQKQATSRTAIYVIAALLVIIGAVGGVVYYRNHLAVMEEHAKLEAQQRQLEQQEQTAKAEAAKAQAANTALQHQVGMSPQEIMDKYGNTVVVVHVTWHAYDKVTGKPVFHKTVCPIIGKICGPSEYLPAYIKWGGNYYRWLTTDDDEHTNYPIGGIVRGSGFVIDPQGFIMTNRHVAVSWKEDYSSACSCEDGRGVVFDIQQQKERNFSRTFLRRMRVFDVHEWESEFRSLMSWTPADGGYLFANDQPVLIARGMNTFEGKNESIGVRFPGAHNDVEARLVRNSEEADLALLKVDPTSTLTFAPMATDYNIKVGEPVTVLGYPRYALKDRVVVGSDRAGGVAKEEVPEPTITTGSISKQRSKPDNLVKSDSDMYQMTVTVGNGSSGGPVFNGDGKVIGVMTAMSTITAGVSYAVPINYARYLIDLQRSSSN